MVDILNIPISNLVIKIEQTLEYNNNLPITYLQPESTITMIKVFFFAVEKKLLSKIQNATLTIESSMYTWKFTMKIKNITSNIASQRRTTNIASQKTTTNFRFSLLR